MPLLSDLTELKTLLDIDKGLLHQRRLAILIWFGISFNRRIGHVQDAIVSRRWG